MEMFDKVGEAAAGLWLAFSTRERIIFIYAAFFAVTLAMGVAAERKRKREQRELREDVVDAVHEALRGADLIRTVIGDR